MAKVRIEHDRPNCIGCAACSAIAPDQWEMNADGKVDAKKTEVEDSEKDLAVQAAESCPVNVIHVIDKDGKKLI